jgi:hypothetical protein
VPQGRPPGNTLVRNDTHGIRDRDVNHPVLLIDPTRAIKLPHLLRTESSHVGRRIGLKTRRRIHRKRRGQCGVRQRLWVEPPGQQCAREEQAEHQGDGYPDESFSDIAVLVARGRDELFCVSHERLLQA